MAGYEQLGLQTVHRIGILALSVILVLLVLELVRRGHLKERYALLWLATAAGSLVVGIAPTIITRLAYVFQFQYLTVLFAMYFLFTLGLVLSFSVVISQLSERNRELTQEVALLAQTVEKLEKRFE
jgi:hypothetical protein